MTLGKRNDDPNSQRSAVVRGLAMQLRIPPTTGFVVLTVIATTLACASRCVQAQERQPPEARAVRVSNSRPLTAPADGRVTSPAVQPPRRWPDEFQAGVFSCHADLPLAPYRDLLGRLGGLQLDLQRELEIDAPRERIHLFLFAHSETYEAYVKLYFPDAPMRRALFVKEGRAPGMVFAALSKKIETDIQHEGTHALLHSVLPMVPLWLDEGLAEYFEVKPNDRKKNNPALSRTQWAVRFRQHASIESLEALEKLQQMGAAEYRYSWAWVHFMLHGPQPLREELRAYLKDIQSHTPPGVLSERLRRRMPDLDQRFVEHFLNWKG